MPKTMPSISVPLPVGGINRFDDRSPDQAADALDVIPREGRIARRPGFKSIATAAPHLLPAGRFMQSDGSTTYYPDRSATLTSTHTWYFGCFDEFDGIDFSGITHSGACGTNKKLRLYYWNNTTWVEITSFLDTTTKFVAGATNGHQPLSLDGRVSWHKETFTSWTAKALHDGTAPYKNFLYYWIKLVVVNADTGAALALEGTITVARPGHRAFLLEPINGLFPCRLKDRRLLVVGSDRKQARGIEVGGKLGVWQYHGKTRGLMKVEDEGSGLWDELDWSDYAGSGTLGTNGVLTKNRVDYDWFATQWYGATILENLVPVPASCEVYSITITAPTDIPFGKYEGLYLLCTTAAGGGVASGAIAQIYYSEDATIRIYPAFSAVPVAGDRFAIISGAVARFRNTGDAEYACRDATANTVELTSDADWTGATWSAGVPTAQDGRWQHWELGRPMEHAVRAGQRWQATYDTVTGRLLLTNGVSGLLAYDGVRLRADEADWESLLAQKITGFLNTTKLENLSLTTEAVLMRQPPSGKYVINYMGYLVVANFSGDPTALQWSEYGPVNNIWPKVYRTQIRDALNDPITGMASLGGNLIVFTRSSIHESGPPDPKDGFVFRPMSVGLGFTAHDAVEAVPVGGQMALLGPTPAGIAAYAGGGQPTILIDNWKRLLEYGVNQSLMHMAVAAYLPQRRWYVLAVPSAGATRNDTILVFDLSSKSWWRWSAPFGAASLAATIMEDGTDALLLGTNDGHIQILMGWASTDDGETITGYVESSAIEPLKGRKMAATSLVLSAEVSGNGEHYDVSLYLDDKTKAYQTAQVANAAGMATWGTAKWDAASVYWGDNRSKLLRIGLRPGAKAAVFRYRIGGAGKWEVSGVNLEGYPLSSVGHK